MTLRQHPAVQAAFEQQAREASRLLQIAGLRPIDPHLAGCETPGEYQRMAVRMAQSTLPPSVSKSIRAIASPAMPEHEFAKHAQAVADAVLTAAHESETLRTVVTKDQTGRETMEFFGRKSAWMRQFQTVSQVMTRCGNATF